jgi:hypothetical protein
LSRSVCWSAIGILPESRRAPSFPLQLIDETANAERVARLHGPSFKSGMEENLMCSAFYRKVGGPSRAICWMPSFKLTVCNRTAKACHGKRALSLALF